jgi:hypothetical protein
MQGINNYVLEAHHVSRAYNVAATLLLQFMYFYVSTSWSMWVQCPVWLFSVLLLLLLLLLFIPELMYTIMEWCLNKEVTLCSINFYVFFFCVCVDVDRNFWQGWVRRCKKLFTPSYSEHVEYSSVNVKLITGSKTTRFISIITTSFMQESIKYPE